MIKSFCFCLAFLVAQIGLGQEWSELGRYKLEEKSVWYADLLGNLYVANKDVLLKYDTTGQQRFSQSIKSIGRIESISAINTLKIVLFSEQQQTFTLMDNTLSEANKTYDLGNMGFGYVSMVAVSSQPSKMWVYDQMNSKLVLLDLNKSNQQQEIENLRGLLRSKEIERIEESENRLFLSDTDGNIFVFDLYGSLIEAFSIGDYISYSVSGGEVYFARGGKLYLHLKNAEEDEMELKLPCKTIQKVIWTNGIVFIESEGEVIKYRAKF